MFKEKLSKVLMRILYIFFAVVVSIALWIFVEMTENREQIGEVSNIEFRFSNEDVLRDRGFLISSVITEPLTLEFAGSRAAISRLLVQGALTVDVDLASITSPGTVQLAYRINFPPGVNSDAVDIRNRSATRITLIVDRLTERSVPVRVNQYTGGTADPGVLIAETVEWDPHFITVRGPGAAVNRISHVRVPILRENLEATYTADLPFYLFDENDEPLDLDEATLELLSFSQETIRVVVPIREIKAVTLMVELFHGTTTSAANTSWSVEPTVITVMGDPDVIRNYNSIPLGTVNMLQYEQLTFTVPFVIHLPPHLTNISGETEASVRVEIFGLEIAHRSTPNIHAMNVLSGHRADIVTQSLDVRIRGMSEDLALVTPMDIRVVADLTGMNRGTARVPAKIYIDGIDADIDPVGDYFITVSIVEE